MSQEVNVPPPKRGSKPKWPFPSMAVGEMAYVDGCTYQAISTARRYWEAKLKWKFAVRGAEQGGFNIWRTE